jgi:formate hydrogenlyase transcriptional activator
MLQLDALVEEPAEQQQPVPIGQLQTVEVERARAVPVLRLPQLVHPGAGEAALDAEDGSNGGLELGDAEHLPRWSNLRAGSPKTGRPAFPELAGHRFSEMLRNLVACGATRRRSGAAVSNPPEEAIEVQDDRPGPQADGEAPQEMAAIYRDLYEEAPIAYVREDLDSRLISANRAALRILGLEPHEVPGILGKSLVPETPDAQRRVQEALASIGRGTETSGVVLELRRKNDGRPVWIQWWSRPESNGRYTRTMFLDITERVLMEQEKAKLQAQNLYLQEEIKSVHNFEEIVGRHPALLAVLAKVDRVARTDATVLITGESGTGKELIARAIHSRSRRSEKPLIKVNCAALPTGLVESELFGHEKGAFSGALSRRLGRFELANGGTIFLDEVGEMAPDAQVKLLRVIQEHEFERIGGNETIRTDVRLIAATNRELRSEVQEGTFREDLFYRLNVFPVELPSLRDRASDIPLLVRFFVEKYSVRVDRHIETIAPETLERLSAYRWPGNVRELQNLVERALILATDGELRIEQELLGGAAPQAGPTESTPSKDLRTLQREHILAALRRSGWVIEGERGAARELGLHPNTLRSRIKKLGLKRSDGEAS